MSDSIPSSPAMSGPNVYFNVPLSRVAIGHRDEFSQPDAVKAAIAEFISTLIFVFAGSGIAFNKLTDSAATTPSGLVAVTFGLFVGRNITLFRGILYIIARLRRRL